MANYSPGFHMHFIHAKRLAATPWGWRPGFVSSVEGREVTVAYLEDGNVTLWHHEEIDGLVVGFPVRVHEQYGALEVAGTWFNALMRDGLGAVPEPKDLEPWREASSTPVFVEIRTGRARRGQPLG
jgi:hypothetical protein